MQTNSGDPLYPDRIECDVIDDTLVELASNMKGSEHSNDHTGASQRSGYQGISRPNRRSRATAVFHRLRLMRPRWRQP